MTTLLLKYRLRAAPKLSLNATPHYLPQSTRKNYYFVFYSERLDVTWIISSEEFIAEAVQNKTRQNTGRRSIWFSGAKIDNATKKKVEYPKPRYDKYRVADFSVFRQVTGLVVTPEEA
jgi:hypothetical protein